MKLIVGLGNPGKDYENTRHNMGWMAIDSYCKEYGIEMHLEPKFQGLTATINVNGHKAILLKPITYMNLSGESIIKVKNHYHIEDKDILIILDDFNLPLSKLRLREKGSSGGHNGLKSIVSVLNTEEFLRLRIGIGNPNNEHIDFVLSKFSKEELDALLPSFNKTNEIIDAFLNNLDIQKIQNLIANE